MANSSYTIQMLVDQARTQGDLAPVLPTGGFFETLALSVANDVMTDMLLGSAKGSRFNFKFNRTLVPPFFINSWEQDYASSLVNIGWLESCLAYNTSSTVVPKPTAVIEVKRDLLLTGVNGQGARYAQICWMQNNTLTFGTWGQSIIQSFTGLTNPGPGVKITNPLGLTAMPINPVTQVVDAFGNLWIVTPSTIANPNGGYGTCGNTNPFLTNLNPVYPTLASPSTVATTVTDGTVQWTAVWPQGQGFRIAPMPSQTGPVWQIAPVAQARIAQFTNIDQTLDPIPDDYYRYFKQGFCAYCYGASPDPKVRAKFDMAKKLWMESLNQCVSQGSREDDAFGFVPTDASVMDTGLGWASQISPAWPYGPLNGY
jgi:hypothetical protein